MEFPDNVLETWQVFRAFDMVRADLDCHMGMIALIRSLNRFDFRGMNIPEYAVSFPLILQKVNTETLKLFREKDVVGNRLRLQLAYLRMLGERINRPKYSQGEVFFKLVTTEGQVEGDPINYEAWYYEITQHNRATPDLDGLVAESKEQGMPRSQYNPAMGKLV